MLVNDFEVHENRVIKYIGNGGNVAFPRGCEEIDFSCFFIDCENYMDRNSKIKSLEIPAGYKSVSCSFPNFINCETVKFDKEYNGNESIIMSIREIKSVVQLYLPDCFVMLRNHEIVDMKELKRIFIGKNTCFEDAIRDDILIIVPDDYDVYSNIYEGTNYKRHSEYYNVKTTASDKYNDAESILRNIFFAIILLILWIVTIKNDILNTIVFAFGIVNLVVGIVKFLKY